MDKAYGGAKREHVIARKRDGGDGGEIVMIGRLEVEKPPRSVTESHLLGRLTLLVILEKIFSYLLKFMSTQYFKYSFC